MNRVYLPGVYLVLGVFRRHLRLSPVCLAAMATFAVSCQYPSPSPRSYSVGPHRYLSARAAHEAYDLVVEGKVTSVGELISRFGEVKCYRHTEGLYFPFLTGFMAEEYRWYHATVSERFQMNYCIFDVKTSEEGDILGVSLEYELGK